MYKYELYIYKLEYRECREWFAYWHMSEYKETTNDYYDHLPKKTAGAEPWANLCADLIGLYYIKKKSQKENGDAQAMCDTIIIDPATGWL